MKESSLSLSLRRSVRTQGSFDSRGLLFPHVRAAPRESLYRTWENTGLCLVTFGRAGGGRWRRRRRPGRHSLRNQSGWRGTFVLGWTEDRRGNGRFVFVHHVDTSKLF